MPTATVHIHPQAVRRGAISAIQHATGRIAMSDGRLISWAEYHQRTQQIGDLPGGRFLDPQLARARNQRRRDQAEQRCRHADPETTKRSFLDMPGVPNALGLDTSDLDGPGDGPGAA